MLKLIGYIVFGVSILIWFSIPVVPFLGFTVGKASGITTGLIIAGEITFYLSIFMIGKEFLVKLKNIFKFRKSKIKSLTEKSDSIGK
ncbi:MAG: hypothetical protein C0397_11635 [Odoribacter sp.]|nr:hypothetical protein [Odoribacter sp.]